MVEIGYFKERHGDRYPAFQATPVAIQNKDRVLKYMKSAAVIAAAPGIMRDVFTNEPILGEMLAYSDGSFCWETETIYYFDRYNMKLPEEFLNMISD